MRVFFLLLTLTLFSCASDMNVKNFENERPRFVLENYFDGNFYKIQLLHSLIWLSLTEYTKDNIDSVIASFYLGLFHLEEGFF